MVDPKDIEKKLHEIATSIFREMKKDNLPDDPGLLSGRTGIIVFCFTYLQRYPDPELSAALDSFIDKFYDRITSVIGSMTFCDGMAGVLTGLKYLNEEKLLDVDISDVESAYKPMLCEFALKTIANEYYDYLHGGLGVVKYLSHDVRFVNDALLLFDETAEKRGNVYKWKSRLGADHRTGYNIALSHGISSIVSVLSMLTEEGIDKERRDRLVSGACNYILSQEIEPQKYGCFFPSQSLENNAEKNIFPSRMGWCYGDLGISTSLWQAGRLLNNRRWQDKAIRVGSRSSRRRDYRNCGIFDSGLCHGTASICMMYHYLYIQTGNELFKETRNYWLDCTLDMGTKNIGLAGYRAWNGEIEGYVDDYGLLEGISGIGMMLLTLLSGDNDSKWMNFFMLN